MNQNYKNTPPPPPKSILVLERNKTLQILCLESNYITCFGATILACGLEKNFSLMELGLETNEIKICFLKILLLYLF